MLPHRHLPGGACATAQRFICAFAWDMEDAGSDPDPDTLVHLAAHAATRKAWWIYDRREGIGSFNRPHGNDVLRASLRIGAPPSEHAGAPLVSDELRMPADHAAQPEGTWRGAYACSVDLASATSGLTLDERLVGHVLAHAAAHHATAKGAVWWLTDRALDITRPHALT